MNLPLFHNRIQQFSLNKNMKKKIISFIVFPLFVCAAAYAQGIKWTPANPMNKARAYFVAVELLNGNVLVAGGFDGSMTNFDFPDAENLQLAHGGVDADSADEHGTFGAGCSPTGGRSGDGNWRS